MHIYYHRDPLGNFGDDLNPWLWPRVFPNMFAGTIFHDPKARGALPENTSLFLGIGTLLNTNVPQNPIKHVFGSGVGYGPPPALDSTWDIIFVRGPLSARALSLSPEKAIADPALIATDYFVKKEHNKRGKAFMPHCSSARQADWKRLCDEASLEYIDPHWGVEEVLTALANTSSLITEALHGAILAEAFRIPWTPICSSPAVLDFKWRDWCMSIDRNYDPHHFPALWSKNETAFSKIKSYIKEKIIINKLKTLANENTETLSPEKKITTLKEKIYQAAHEFKGKNLNN